MDGNFPQQLVQQCITLLNAWPGPGIDSAILEAVACNIEALGRLSDPALRSQYHRVAKAWQSLIHALEACDPDWNVQRIALVAELKAWSLPLA